MKARFPSAQILLETMPQAVMILDDFLNITYANPAAQSLLKIAPEPNIPFPSWLSAAERIRLNEALHRLAQGEKKQPFHLTLQTNQRPLICEVELWRLEEKQLGVMLSPSTTHLVNQALLDGAIALKSSLDWQEIIQRLLDNLMQILPDVMVDVMIVQDELMKIVASRGYERVGLAEWINTFQTPLSEESLWTAKLKAPQALVLHDAQNSPHWIQTPETTWIRSHMSLPMLLKEEVIGFIHINHPETNMFSQEDLQKVAFFAEQACLALHNARLYEAEREQRRFNETLSALSRILNNRLGLGEAFQSILESVGQIFQHEGANIILINEAGVGRVVALRGYPEGPVHEWVRHSTFQIQDYPDMLALQQNPRQPLIISNTRLLPDWQAKEERHPFYDWVQSHIKTAIVIDGEVLGFLSLDSSRAYAFNKRHAQNLQLFTEHIAVFLRSARLNEALARQQARLAAILDGTGEGIFYTEGLVVVYINRAFAELVGLDPADLVGQSLSALPWAENCQAPPFNIYTEASQSTYTQETAFQLPDKSRRAVSLTVWPIRQDAGQPSHAVTLVRDIQQEKELHEMQKRFLVHAEHQIRHPIANIISRLYLLRRNLDNAERHLPILEREAQRLVELSEHMKLFSEIESGQWRLEKRLMRLSDVIQPVLHELQPMAEAKHVHIEAHLNNKNDLIHADAQLLSSLVRLLLQDSLLFNPTGARLKLEVTLDEQALTLSLQDERPHHHAQEIAFLFQPFYAANTGEFQHSGLELTLVKRIVDMHHGTIDVQPRSDQGLLFALSLPL
jgi:PAS domain S-box-containing protein